MATYTQTATVNGDAPQFEVTYPPLTQDLGNVNDGEDILVKFPISVVANVPSVVTFGNVQITGGTQIGTTVCRIGTGATTVNSGDTLSAGANLNIEVTVRTDSLGVGETAPLSVSVDAEVTQV